MFKTIKEDVSAEIVEKKSRFIANLFYVESQEDAENKIKEMKKKYFDARHNCSAYSIYSKDGIINKFSDDGEPSGTAGSPMLNILTNKEITNVVVIVTRYFGGILLGTGGLVRAYTDSLVEALNKTDIVEKDLGFNAKINCNYSELEKLKYYLSQNNINITDIRFNETIDVFIDINQEKYDNLLNNKNELNFVINNIEKLEEKYIEA